MNLIDRAPEGAAASGGGLVPEGVEGRLELRDVTFDYPVRSAEGAAERPSLHARRAADAAH